MTTDAAPIPPSALSGFSAIHRHWIEKENRWMARIHAGECYVTRHDEIIGTTLGSCVAACIRDPFTGIGGMNHFLLPRITRSDSLLENSRAARSGQFAMELLINSILRFGSLRSRLEIKVFGGATIMNSDVGQRNVEFVHTYLETEGLEIMLEDIGENHGRQVHYYPASGRVLVKRQEIDRQLVEAELATATQQTAAEPETDIELF